MSSSNRKRSWSDLSPSSRAGVIALALVELVLTTAAMRDLKRRPRAQVRGPKWFWRLVAVVQPVGPMTPRLTS